jgi:hypothetical protein
LTYAAYKDKRMSESRRLDIVIDGPATAPLVEGLGVTRMAKRDPGSGSCHQAVGDFPARSDRPVEPAARPNVGHAPIRAGLYYCPVCFDITDGILTVEIGRTPEAVIWRTLGWKDEEQDGGEDALIPNMTDFTFDPAAYDSVLNRVRADFSRRRCSEWISRWWSGPMRPGEHSPSR